MFCILVCDNLIIYLKPYLMAPKLSIEDLRYKLILSLASFLNQIIFVMVSLSNLLVAGEVIQDYRKH